MSVEAPISRYKKQNLMLMAVVLLGLSIWFYYDGYHNEKFIEKHTKNGQPDSTLKFNRQSPPFLAIGGIGCAIYWWLIRHRKVVADDKKLDVNGLVISYDAIEKIDMTDFQNKGKAVIYYQNEQKQPRTLTLSDRMYDNLATLLDFLANQIR